MLPSRFRSNKNLSVFQKKSIFGFPYKKSRRVLVWFFKEAYLLVKYKNRNITFDIAYITTGR